jgi:hypothetical protein
MNQTLQELCTAYVQRLRSEAIAMVYNDICSSGKNICIATQDGRYTTVLISHREVMTCGAHELLDLIQDRLDAAMKILLPPSTKDFLSDIMADYYRSVL